MREFTGKHASCKVFTDDIEATAEEQIQTFLDCPAFEGAKIRIMPDVHAGAGAVIGFTAPVGDKVIPNVIGVDIGCGVRSIRLSEPMDIPFAELDRNVREAVPAGFSVREHVYPRLETVWRRQGLGPFAPIDKGIGDICEKTGQDEGRVWRSIGTLGGGNHFIELGEGGAGRQWLTVHSGSRNFGLKVALYHQKKAIAKMGKNNGLEWLEWDDAAEYLTDMRVAQLYATLNRACMMDAMMEFIPEPDLTVESVHNFIGHDDVIRKGAIFAGAGSLVVIPWNMRDGLIIGRGKGNDDWNNSAPHGAGRTMGRKQAKRTLSVDDFRQTMSEAGVWSSCVGEDTLDEAPGAYKEHSGIQEALEPTVEVLDTIRPIYSFKASKHEYKPTAIEGEDQ